MIDKNLVYYRINTSFLQVNYTVNRINVFLITGSLVVLKHLIKPIILGAIFSVSFQTIQATPLLKDHYPKQYVVQKGDTIYEIAKKYLNKPWQWRRIWRNNPQIKNPKRLYPGTVLNLDFYAGKPHLTVVGNGTYKLSPQSRPRPAEKAIPAIHLRDIKPFLNRSQIFDVDELGKAGYVVAFKGEHLRGSQDEQVYVKDLHHYAKSGLSYAIYRPAGIYKNPKYPNLCLGYKATFIGDAQVVKGGNPAILELTQITEGVQITDRVVVNNKLDFDLYFDPKAPNHFVKGDIIDIFGGLNQVASNQVVVLDQGKNTKLEPGDVVAIWQPPRLVPDPLNRENIVTIPKEKIGEAMIFKAFSYVSFALVVNATRSIKAMDGYTSP